jgi:hypothetical protein
LTVSPASLTDSVTGVSDVGRSSAIRARSAFGRLVISSGVSRLVYSPDHTWSPR